MRLEISCHDRVGIGQKVLGVFVEHGINVRGIELKETGRIFINIPDREFSELQSFMPQLRLIEGVGDVKTAPYMPSEREKNELATLIKTFPDPFISIDAKGNIRIANTVASAIMNSDQESLVGQHISQWLKGFNFNKWLDGKDVLAQTRRLKFQGDDYVADIMPINVKGEENNQVLAGAVLILKSEARLGQQINAFKQPNESTFNGIQASSSSMRKVLREAKRMSQLDASILIMGETGTGKELLARACHGASERSEHPFMTLNCAALPDDVAESELFGTGEKDQQDSKRGIFELADGGTVFLDEIGEMSAKLQSKLLRVIQNGSFRRVDSENEVTVNVRIISSTNKDLLNLVSIGDFREDLYYRLNVFGLSLPALRERRSDILPLAETFITQSAQRIGRTHLRMSDECRDFVEHYPWPGNVRQLENVLTRAASLLEGEEIEVNHLQLPAYTREHGYLEQEFEGTLDAAVKNFEADLLRKLYPAYPSTRQLAKKLGLSHTAIANKLREYDINKKTVKI
ncbi:transcriptional regulator TyrR [Litorilituus lipolyticus]|uniref:HTH-type transcriptional regulatory protein TyrR n=1 Tax=Litorilituus lipolyticus TaxID=2491017 RepID=A0A502LHD0_9GAMM|nr:transcriptional regulator TyrR [Litorilituus lipolyticus]TPH19167.1 transcriptional regulator TyrR [Litorilituus lipolyticus]